MAEKIDLNISPYYDDYSEDKKFHKILYRAGRPIQARELTQTQSIIQNQVERLGSYLFKEGSIVQGAQSDIDLNIFFVKVKSANPNEDGDTNVESYRESFHGKYIRGATTGVVAKVISTTAETSDDPCTLYVKFISQGTDDFNSTTFYSQEILKEVTIDEDGVVTDVESNDNDFEVQTRTVGDTPVGYSSAASITEGVIFTRGYYVKVDKQFLILEKYSKDPSYRIGLNINEQVISSADDLSLNDNSQGTSNENAAGADRLKIQLTLAKQSLLTTDNLNFIELARVNEGVIERRVTEERLGGIERTLARRTNDTNGDFIVNPFTPQLREHLNDYTNNGFYTTSAGGDSEKFVMQVSSGKAYVKGYEITKSGATILPFQKARNTISLSNTSTPVRLGNELRVQNVFGLPDFGNEGGSFAINEFGVLGLYDDSISTGGTTAGDLIGYARVRDIRFYDGDDTSGIFDTSGSDIAQFNLSLFDIKMFTRVTGTTSGANFVAGDRVTGSVSGAHGIVATTVTSGGSAISLHDVVGTFTTADTITAESNAATITTVSAVRTYNIDRARSVASEHEQTSTNFTADVVTNSSKVLQGTIKITSGSDQVEGTFGTRFVTELKEGDILLDGSGAEHVVESVESEDSLTLVSNASASVTGNVIRKRASLTRQNETPAIFAWSRDFVKTATVSATTVRRQQVTQVTSAQITVSKSDGETFVSTDSRTGLTITVIDAASNLSEGDVLDPTSPSVSVSVSGNTLTISGTAITASDNGAKVLVSYTVQKTNPNRNTKTLRQSRCLSVESLSSTGVEYGTAYDHKDISLGVSDVLRVHGIYEGIGDSDPLPPSATLYDPSATFQNFETVVGQTSNARAVLIKYTNNDTSYFYYTTPNTFIEGEYVVGRTSNAQATLNVLTAGSKNIKDRYVFDDGQRDGYYDLSKITLKPNQPTPNGKILIVFDYFTSSGGDYYDVDSYTSIDYDDIPVYSPNRIDLGGLEPDGTYELSDAIDCRPSVGQILGNSNFASSNPDPTNPTDLSDVSGDGARYAPFSYVNGRSFDSTRTNITNTFASQMDTPVDGTAVDGDIEFYVPRIDKVFLHKTGVLQISGGTPSLSPSKPEPIQDSIELFELFIPAYTLDIDKIAVTAKDHRRYSMKDIGRINTRLSNLERLTALSLLEKDVQSKQVLDSDGLDRFKSGFLVDNFNNHSKGNIAHPDYKCSTDKRNGYLRPQNNTGWVDLQFNESSSSNFAKTGKALTLPFTEVKFINQPMASRSINVNPFNVFAYIGHIHLDPASDTWVDTERLEDTNKTIDNYSVVFNKATEQGLLGETWNDWQLSWVGEPEVVEGSQEEIGTSDGYWTADPAQGGTWVNGTTTVQQQTQTKETETRNGINTSVMEYYTEERNDRMVNVQIVPYIRKKTVTITGTGLKPNANHYFFFDGIRVDSYTKPASSSYSSTSSTNYTATVRTDGNGKFIAYFSIPNNDTLRFPTGTKELRVTSSYYNNNNPSSVGFANYEASGLLQSWQTEIVSTRNGQLVTENLSDSRDTYRYGSDEFEYTNEGDEVEYPYPDPGPVIPPVEPPPPGPVELPIDPPIIVDPGPVDPPPPAGPPDDGPTETTPIITPAPSIESATCNGISQSVPETVGVAIGTSYMKVTGGTPPYNYNWNVSRTSTTGTTTGFYTSGGQQSYITLNFGTRGTIITNNATTSGTITCTVTDSNGETATASNTFSLSVGEQPVIPAEIAVTVPEAPVPTYRPTKKPLLAFDDHIINSGGAAKEDFWMVYDDGYDRVRTRDVYCERQWLDPLAQSFLVDSSNGVYTTSVDLFFRTKSTNGAPVRVEIRNMVNGYPGPVIVPFSIVSKNPSDINISEDGTSATTFEFESPVYLEGNTDYCVVIISNSDEYECWVSRMGDKEISTGEQITSQPSLGSLFKSQNASTWTAEQMEDLKYNLNVASFDTSVVGDIRLENQNIPLKSLRTNPIQTFSGESYIRVTNVSHGLYSTDSNALIIGAVGDRTDSVLRIGNPQLTNVTQAGTYTAKATTYQTGSGGTGLTVDFDIEDVDGTFTVTDLRIATVGQGYSVGDTLEVLNFEGSADLEFEVLNIGDTLSGLPIETINNIHTSLQDIAMDSFNVDLTSILSYWEGNGKLKSGWSAQEDSNGGGVNVECTQNIYYDLLHTIIPSIQHSNTVMRASVQTTVMSSPEGYIDKKVNGTNYSPYDKREERINITMNDNNFMPAPSVVASRLNENNEMASQRSFEVRIQMISYSPNVSPFVDIDAVGCVLNMNRINKIDTSSDVPTGTTYVPSTETEGDNNGFVYITRKVNLENPATSLKVLADNFRPEGTELDFMYKIVRNDEETPIDDIGFEFFNTNGDPDVSIPADARNFKEYEYTAEELPEFSSFIIKIVGKSENTSIVPLVSSLRVMALA